MQTVLKTVVSALGALLLAASAVAQEAREGQARISGAQISFTPDSNLTIGTLTPTYGMVTLPVAAADPLSYALQGTSSVMQDFTARYAASIYGGQVGVFARYADRTSGLSGDTSSAFNLGASVGYAGFYFQGAVTGINDNRLVRYIQSWQSLEAGFGYGAGAFDVRLTYSMAEASPAFANRSFDNSQWMLGGIYEIAPGIRFNADAFMGSRFINPGLASAAPGVATPQGTGARVGVQLRF